MLNKLLLIFLTFSWLLPANILAFQVTIDAHDSNCFYDFAQSKDKLTIRFEVMEGGFKDIALHITGPDDEKLFESESETSGSFTFSATWEGDYQLCFDNSRSTLTPKILMFHFEVIKDLSHYLDPSQRTDDVVEQSQLQESINALSSQLFSIKHEQEYMRARYKGHQDLSHNVHFRIVAWSVSGPSLLLTMTTVEVYYLKRFFEVKRVV